LIDSDARELTGLRAREDLEISIAKQIEGAHSSIKRRRKHNLLVFDKAKIGNFESVI
jgi:hypothetical protein